MCDINLKSHCRLLIDFPQLDMHIQANSRMNVDKTGRAYVTWPQTASAFNGGPIDTHQIYEKSDTISVRKWELIQTNSQAQ